MACDCLPGIRKLEARLDYYRKALVAIVASHGGVCCCAPCLIAGDALIETEEK